MADENFVNKDLINDINKFLSDQGNVRRYGYNKIKQDYHQKIQQYLSAYRGDIDEVHTYHQDINGTDTLFKVQSLQMVKMGTKDKVALSFSEQVTINVPTNQDELDKMLEYNNFNNYIPSFVEKCYGYAGYGFLTEFNNELNNKLPIIDFITAEDSYVVGHNNAKITDILTVSRITSNEGRKTANVHSLLTLHSIHNGLYEINHFIYKSKDKTTLGTPVIQESGIIINDGIPEEWLEMDMHSEYTTDNAHFQIIQLNTANNHDPDVPYALPLIANAYDTSIRIDQRTDQLHKEFNLKQARVLINKSALNSGVVVGNEIIQTFDVNNPLFQVVDLKNGAPIVEINTGDIRIQQYYDGINMDLKLFSKQFGLGNDFYSLDQQTGLMTATQVISDKSELYKNKKKDEKILEQAFIGMVKALEQLSGIEFGEPVIGFDDSIIVDDQQLALEDKALVQDGMMGKVRWLMVHRNLSKPEALKWLGEVEFEIESGFSSFGSITPAPTETPVEKELDATDDETDTDDE